MDIEDIQMWFNTNRENTLFHRYINLQKIGPLINKVSTNFEIKVIGHSVERRPIYGLKIGIGSNKILMWSQMHGNESTTTKALFDLVNSILNEPNLKWIQDELSLFIIPMLNPDGAEQYTRVNANGIDLNRDAQQLTQPESIALRQIFETFKPDYCFNLHGQRTIFGTGTHGKSATVSFLAPAQDEALTVTNTRLKAMSVINAMNNALQKVIPGQIGLYDDAYNINCVGDTFQGLNVPTILFEAGHYSKDYCRDQTRFYIYVAFLYALKHIQNNSITDTDTLKDYQSIPLNQKCFYDIIFRNVCLDETSNLNDVAIQYREVLKSEKIDFIPEVVKIGNLSAFFGHKEIEANGYKLETHEKKAIYEGYENDFVLMKNEKILLLP
ncbi:DUF2817 domain-containing protein [Paucihalobacter ruber]|uniref:DUF2817 domain-containing protein n=1 Tax=Paucihalobacter ruber TaxID=2567861 RepID=A0A506PII8_9FLAO|nr:M14 family zinc carboxypeptidase [Paucihalobacter ruber]TPV33348.1 DUF2817 domain-containing protein [Paucihalobacter ruber]